MATQFRFRLFGIEFTIPPTKKTRAQQLPTPQPPEDDWFKEFVQPERPTRPRIERPRIDDSDPESAASDLMIVHFDNEAYQGDALSFFEMPSVDAVNFQYGEIPNHLPTIISMFELALINQRDVDKLKGMPYYQLTDLLTEWMQQSERINIQRAIKLRAEKMGLKGLAFMDGDQLQLGDGHEKNDEDRD